MPISIPKFFQRAFAQNGGKQDVPITGDTSGGRASYDVGFPPVTRIPIVAGGIPPFGTDFNGVLYDLSQAIQYVQSGVAFPFNQDFATAIGGYEIGAIVSDTSDNSLMWINGTASNVSFPAGWTSFAIKDPTETVRGMPLVATQAEVDAGVDDAKQITSKKLRMGVSYSLGDNGYIAFPTWLGGFMIVWGFSDIQSSGVQNIAFPMAFPSSCFSMIALDSGASPQTADIISAWNKSRTGFTVYARSPDTGLGVSSACTYIAVGK